MRPVLKRRGSNIIAFKTCALRNMVAIAQLAEHRIVVPSVVGSSPTSHPKKDAQKGVFFFLHVIVGDIVRIANPVECLSVSQPVL